jgi:hypothetical protein
MTWVVDDLARGVAHRNPSLKAWVKDGRQTVSPLPQINRGRIIIAARNNGRIMG